MSRGIASCGAGSIRVLGPADSSARHRGRHEFPRTLLTGAGSAPHAVPERGFEPPPSYLDKNLNLARLPIPPLGQVGWAGPRPRHFVMLPARLPLARDRGRTALELFREQPR